MNPIQRIFKNILSVGWSSILPRISTFILVVYIARYLGDVSFGKYSTAMYFTLLLSLLADLGITKLTIREVAKNREHIFNIFNSVLVLKFSIVVITYVLIVAGGILLAYPQDIRELINIFGAAACLLSLSKLFLSAFEAFERMEYEAAVTTVHAILKFSLGISVLMFNLGLRWLAYTFLIARVVEFGIIVVLFYTRLYHVKRSRFTFDIALIKQFIRQAIPFSAILLLAEIYFKIDMVMLSKMRTMDEVGWYSSVYNLLIALILIPGIVMRSLFPLMSRSSESSLERLTMIYDRSFKYLLYLSVLLVLVLSFFATDIISFFYGDTFTNAAIAFHILLWTLPFIFTDTIIGNVLTSLNMMKIQIVVLIVGITLNVSLNFYFITRWGYVGASITTLISAVINFTMLFVYVTRKFRKIEILKYLRKIIIPALLMVGIWLLFKQIELTFFVPAGICVVLYLAGLWLTKAFDEQDREILRKLISGRI